MSKVIQGIFLFLIIAMYVVNHEVTHAEIDRQYGCTDIHYGFKWYGFQTIAKCPNNDSAMAQSINEVVGYNIMPILLIIVALMVTKDD